MQWVTLAVAMYGAALSSVLGYLVWRKDRHSIRFFLTYHRRSDWYGLVINVVNVGFRPVTVNDFHFELPEGAGYLNELDEALDLPKRLDEGEQLSIRVHAEDIEPDTTALVIRDTHRREHRREFTPDARKQLNAFRDHIEESQPRLFAEGQRRLSHAMRQNRPIADPDRENF